MVLPRNRGQCQWGLDKARMCLPLSQPWWRPFQFSLMLPAPCVRLCAKNLTSLLVYSAQWPFRQIPLQKKQSWFAQGFGHRSSLLSRRSLGWETCAALPLPCAHSRRSAVHWGPKCPRGAYYLIGVLVPPLTEESSTPETVRWKANHCQIWNQRGSRHQFCTSLLSKAWSLFSPVFPQLQPFSRREYVPHLWHTWGILMEGSCRRSWRMKGSGPDAGEVGMSPAARDALTGWDHTPRKSEGGSSQQF